MRDDQDATWRKRVGSYRILLDLNSEERIVEVQNFHRRASKTYRKRQNGTVGRGQGMSVVHTPVDAGLKYADAPDMAFVLRVSGAI